MNIEGSQRDPQIDDDGFDIVNPEQTTNLQNVAHANDIDHTIDMPKNEVASEVAIQINDAKSEAPAEVVLRSSIINNEDVSPMSHPTIINCRRFAPLTVTQLMIDGTIADFVSLIGEWKNDGTLMGIGTSIIACACTAAVPRCKRLHMADAVTLVTAVTRAYINDQYNQNEMEWVVLHNIIDLYVQDYVNDMIYIDTPVLMPATVKIECCIIS